MSNLLYLIGYRGTGKTTIGPILAARLGWDFVDADAYLEAKCGRTIKEIFSDEGEKGFREQESQNLRKLARRERSVIATGGGIVLSEENRKVLKETGFVVWLSADVATITARIRADPTTSTRRPNLTTGGIAEIESLLRAREPLYRMCAICK